jgi:hypothetical protein
VKAFLGGWAFGWVVLLALAYAATAVRPPEPSRLVAAADHGLTVEGMVDRIDPWMRKAINREVPLGLRWAAHKVCRWGVRKTIHFQIALHGHQVSPVLGAAEPLADRLFRPEVATTIRDVKGLCDTPVKELGEVEEQARAEAGPTPAVTLASQRCYLCTDPKLACGCNEGRRCVAESCQCSAATGYVCPCGDLCTAKRGVPCTRHCGCYISH